jgi:hypothetical protein
VTVTVTVIVAVITPSGSNEPVPNGENPRVSDQRELVVEYDASVLRRLQTALRNLFGPASPLPQIDPALQSSVIRCYQEVFPNKGRPPVSFRIAAEEPDYFVVAVSTLCPGSLDFIRVAKRTNLAAFVEDDRLKYRPRGLK